jgi:hypothetical protein
MFAGGGSTQWNGFDWGEANWGEGTIDMITNVRKLIADSQATTSALLKKAMSKLTGSSVTTSSGPSSERVMDGDGWYHTFVSATDEGESRQFVEWTPRTDDGASWTEATVSTTWS